MNVFSPRKILSTSAHMREHRNAGRGYRGGQNRTRSRTLFSSPHPALSLRRIPSTLLPNSAATSFQPFLLSPRPTSISTAQRQRTDLPKSLGGISSFPPPQSFQIPHNCPLIHLTPNIYLAPLTSNFSQSSTQPLLTLTVGFWNILPDGAESAIGTEVWGERDGPRATYT